MARCSLRRIALFIALLLLVVGTIHLSSNWVLKLKKGNVPEKPRGQKPILRYQLEREIQKLIGRKLTPQNG